MNVKLCSRLFLIVCFLSCTLSAIETIEGQPKLTIGSKRFPESYILAEITARIAEATGEAKVVRKFGLGGTSVVYRALEEGSIDIYPEYTGTILRVILKTDNQLDVGKIKKVLSESGLEITDSLGFNSSYAIAMREEQAKRLGITKISDLRRHPQLVVGFTHEFLERKDGYPGLQRRYGLHFQNVRGLEHGLAYQTIASGQIDIMDVYTTDGKLTKFHLRMLDDDLDFFPRYSGVFLYRVELKNRFPKTYARLKSLEGTLNQQKMIELNAMAELQNKSWPEIADYFLQQIELHTKEQIPGKSGLVTQTINLGLQHLFLVAISMALVVLIGIPLGILSQRHTRLGQLVLGLTGVIQTIPSLALFCFLIPLAGIGPLPAIIALFLYSLLPIVRNTYSGLQDINPRLNESASALGLSEWEILSLIQVPLASRSILSGVKTSTIINVGTATLAALIGAGGYGDPIISGLSLNHIPTILSGAIPAAILALLVHAVFELLDFVLVPKGLRISPH